jgi:hypothetical protein
MSGGAFDRYAAAAQRAAGTPPSVVVSAGMMKPPDPWKLDRDIYETLAALPRQHSYYSFDGSRLSLIRNDTCSEPLIATPSDCGTLAELAVKIKTIDRVDWVWVDVEVGFVLTIDDAGDPKWYTETIWSNACEPFLDWFR